MTEEQLRDFHSYTESDAFSPLEKLVMRVRGGDVARPTSRSPRSMFARLREHFDDEQLVELTAAIAIENFRARFNNALDIPPAGFSEGAYCPMPERSLEVASSGDGAA